MEEKEPLKPILINEDLTPVSSLKKAEKEAIKRIKALEAAYNALGMGTFDKAVFDRFLKGEVDQIFEEYKAVAHETVEKMGIPNPIIKKNLLNGTSDLYGPVYQAVDMLKKLTFSINLIGGEMPFPLDLINFKDGEPVMDDEAYEAFIERYCRVYVVTPEEHEVYAAFQKMNAALNEFYPLIRKLKIEAHSWTMGEISQVFHKKEDGTIFFKADHIKGLSKRLLPGYGEF